MSNVKLKIVETKIKGGETQKNGNVKETRIYFFHNNENVIDQLFARQSRPHNLYKKLLPDVYKALGVSEQNFKASWSQYAGCKCPCSPGFILKGSYDGQVAYVTIDVEGSEEG